jgi:glycosyltransferase involved in cell wall biosynthesis
MKSANMHAEPIAQMFSFDMAAVATVDIVIAAKNEERYIGDCLDALAEQNYNPRLVNVIVVDNGSTDRTREICARKGVQVLCSAGSSVSSSRNIGIRAGTGTLVAFIDAHCVVPPNWLREMSAVFTTRQIGGCQGGIQYRCTDPRTDRLCQHSILNDARFFRDCTIHARGAAYPWIASGNAMYRRRALEQVNLHDEALSIGEDVDLAWRVVLSGYQLVYADSADVIHFYTGSPLQFARRYFMYGIGGARVDRKYALNGRELKPERGDALTSKTFWGEGLDVIRALGRWWETLRMTMKLTMAPAPYTVEKVEADLRDDFQWDTKHLRISPDAIYWREAEERFCVIALTAKERIIFQDTAGAIFSCLVKGMTKDEALNTLRQQYETTTCELNQTLDEFVQQLIEEHILEVTD